MKLVFCRSTRKWIKSLLPKQKNEVQLLIASVRMDVCIQRKVKLMTIEGSNFKIGDSFPALYWKEFFIAYYHLLRQLLPS